MSRAEVVLAAIVSCCVTILISTIAVHCQIVTAGVAETCLEQGNAPLECDEIAIGG